MTPLVSIVINNYNYGRFLRQAIESALAQTYSSCEVLIVDDGSTDQSRSIIAGYADRARIFLKENGGQASAFNVGISEARGDYILLLDSDDYLFPEAVETCLKAFPAGYSRIYYRLQVVDHESKPLVGDSDRAFVFRAFDGAFPTFVTPTSANFFDARKLKAVLPVPEREFRICADEFITIWSCVTGPVRSIDNMLAAYRVHGHNNYYSTASILSEKAILKTRIDSYFRVHALLQEACRKGGYDYKQESEDGNSWLLEVLCAGYKLNVDSPQVAKLTKRKLVTRLGRWVWIAREPIDKRIRRAIYCALVIFAPKMFAGALLRLRD